MKGRSVRLAPNIWGVVVELPGRFLFLMSDRFTSHNAAKYAARNLQTPLESEGTLFEKSPIEFDSAKG